MFFKSLLQNTKMLTGSVPDISSPVQVMLEGETVWLTQAQMAELFQVKPQNITMHLKNFFIVGELQEESTCKDFLQVQAEGSRQVERKRKLYNLDAIISVGYRVNSKRGIRFRQWASAVLRQHLLKGYTLDRQRLAERGLDEARASLELLSRTLEANALVEDTGLAVLRLIKRLCKNLAAAVKRSLERIGDKLDIAAVRNA